MNSFELNYFSISGFNHIYNEGEKHVKVLPYLSIVQATEGSYEIALENNKLPVSINYTAEEITEGVLKDKKRRGGEISFVFPTKVGRCEIVKIPVEEVTELVRKALK